jgi:ribosomal protein S12 methylthiotransferase accessory factor
MAAGVRSSGGADRAGYRLARLGTHLISSYRVAMTVPALRSLSLDEAVEVAVREAERLGIRFETQFASPPGYPIEVSRLLQGGAEVAGGYGKGKGSDGVAGGHFEALERYFISARINRRLISGSASLRTTKDVAGQPGLAGDLVIQRWAEDFPESVAACAAYSNAASPLWYPIFLGDPHYFLAPLPGDSAEPYRNMLRYASSLGIASGANAQCSAMERRLAPPVPGWPPGRPSRNA